MPRRRTKKESKGDVRGLKVKAIICLACCSNYLYGNYKGICPYTLNNEDCCEGYIQEKGINAKGYTYFGGCIYTTSKTIYIDKEVKDIEIDRTQRNKC